MILNNKTIKNIDISTLPISSREKVLRICDRCGDSKEVQYNNIYRCRKKHNTDKDYCFQCSMKVYNTGENNSAKKEEVRKKISENTKGKSKSFKDGDNPRALATRYTNSGYLLKWVPEEKKHIQEHRLIYAQKNGKHHSELLEIHHLNGDKLDNNINNLIELSASEHGELHSQLEKIAFSLIKKNIIFFDDKSKKYFISPNILLQTMENSLGFENIAIKQKKNICKSRLDVDIKSEVIRGIFRPIPLIAANMSTVINSNFYIELYRLGALGILHRADSHDNILKSVKDVAKECEIVAASIGIDDDQFDFAKTLIQAGCNVITIDIAHGYSDLILELGKKIKKFSPHTKIILGNTTNTDIMYECYEFVDAIKVGIAQGLACETKNTAGCTEKQFSAVFKFKDISKKFGIPIISDGGIREPADFTKAIAAGANSVMAGSIFAACPESAAEDKFVYSASGEILTHHKVYAGMASRYVQEKWRGKMKEGTCPEGGVRYMPIGESVKKLLERYSGALKSGITYAGGNSIETFHNNVEFIKI